MSEQENKYQQHGELTRSLYLKDPTQKAKLSANDQSLIKQVQPEYLRKLNEEKKLNESARKKLEDEYKQREVPYESDWQRIKVDSDHWMAGLFNLQTLNKKILKFP